MASAWHAAFRAAGFSEHWLRSTSVGSTMRKRILWKLREQGAEDLTCEHCGDKYLSHKLTNCGPASRARLGNCCSNHCAYESGTYDRNEMAARRAHAQHAQMSDSDFYSSPGWKRARYLAIVRNGSCCQACGRSPFRHGITPHVDHIVPRSIAPERELDVDNLQVLCSECNEGKGFWSAEDWR